MECASYLAGMIGGRAWGVNVGHASCLTFEVGAPRVLFERSVGQTHVAGRSLDSLGASSALVRGCYRVWLHMAHWEVVAQDGHRLVASEDDDAVVAERVLGGQEIADVLRDEAGGVRVRFSSGLEVLGRPYPGSDASDDVLDIDTPEGTVLVKSDGRVVVEATGGEAEVEPEGPSLTTGCWRARALPERRG
jgi:hypothetical protein